MTQKTFAITAILFLMVACTSGAKPGIKAGSPLLADIEPQKVAELAILKSDPESGDRWSARVARDSGDSDGWRIRSAPEGQELTDRRANGNLIAHLMDSLHTLPVTETIDRAASPEAENSLGLDQPRFVFGFSMPGREVTLKLGAKVPKGSGCYAARSDMPGYFIVDGGALRILETLSGFPSIRLSRLVTFPADDVDELEVRNGSRGFYAQRDGSEWTGRDHRPLRKDAGKLLDALVESRITRYVDDPAQARDTALELDRRSDWEAILKDRQGKDTVIHVRTLPRGTFVTISNRPGAIFQTDSRIVGALQTVL